MRAGAVRVEISDPQQWSSGDIAIRKSQEAKQVRDIGSLIFETPIQHDYEAGVEVRSLLSTELVEEIDGKLAVTDVDPSGNRFVKFWIDDVPSSLVEPTAPLGGEPVVTRSSHSQFTVPLFLAERNGEQAPMIPERRGRRSPGHSGHSKGIGLGSPGFGAGVSVYFDETGDATGLSPRMESPQHRSQQIRPQLIPRIPPEDDVPKGCSLLSMEPLREWFCKGAELLGMKLCCANSKRIPAIFANIMTTSGKRGGLTSP